MDAIDFLIRQHREMEASLARFFKTSDEAERKTVFKQVADALTVHITAEEEIFYPAVKEKRTEDILLESLEEHLSLKRLLADLLALGCSAQTFEPKFKVLKEQAEHHHKEEEEHLFPKVKKLLNDTQRDVLGKQMVMVEQRLTLEGEPRQAVVDQTEAAAPLK